MICAPSELPVLTGRLRRFVPEDISAFAELNANPLVMEFFPHPWSFEESQAAFERVQAEFTERGFGVYALETDGEFSGIVGLSVPSFEAHFTPSVEILWRLNPRFWGQGLVTAAARRVLKMAFQELDLAEIVAFAVVENQRSIRVMERLSMERDPKPFFDHPGVAEERLRRHVLYRATRPSESALSDWYR
jgi:RimJ/RimL family protein N-acetyltransferase